MTKCKTIKSRFKIGDEVRIIKPHAHSSNFLNTTFIVTNRDNDWDEEPSWYGAGQPYRYKESQLELAHPPKSTGFEVGKKYVSAKSKARGVITILTELNDGDWAYVFEEFDGGITVGKLHPCTFSSYKEYIPPPPEEWRIVYKDRFGNVTVGKTPFKSESEAKSSRYWIDHPTTAFKTIRVDA